MTENEPLNEKATEGDGQIVSQKNIRLTNGGHCAKESANAAISEQTREKSKSEYCKNGNNLQLEAHIEAPCCRDIHGKEPPDGGMRAWLVMVSAFLCNGVIFGIINTYGVIHSLLTDRLEAQGDKDASSKAGKIFKYFITCCLDFSQKCSFTAV